MSPVYYCFMLSFSFCVQIKSERCIEHHVQCRLHVGNCLYTAHNTVHIRRPGHVSSTTANLRSATSRLTRTTPSFVQSAQSSSVHVLCAAPYCTVRQTHSPKLILQYVLPHIPVRRTSEDRQPYSTTNKYIRNGRRSRSVVVGPYLALAKSLQ